MSKHKRETIPLWAQLGHKKPTSRREFLGYGLIPFAAQMMAPNLLGMLFGSRAHAATCPDDSATNMIPFVSVVLAGGAAMSSNFVPMNAGGEPLKSYDVMGLGNGQVPLEREFGNVPFAGNVNGALLSKFLEGIRATANATTLSKSSFIGVCVRSRDDFADNPVDLSGAVVKAGLVGSKISNIGTSNTPTGSQGRSAIINPPAPLIVSSVTDLETSLGYSNFLGQRLNMMQKNKLAKLITNLNNEQTRRLASVSSGAQVQTLVECAGIKNEQLVTEGVSAVDPISNASVASVWGIQANTEKNNRNYIFGAMIYNSLLNQAGAVSIVNGGYDYHNNNRTTGDTKDRQAGEIIGRILSTAAALSKPVFIYVTSDGAVASAKSEDRNSPWVSDRGTAGAAYIIMYHPSGRPATSATQIGYFTEGQAADDKFIIGNDPALAAQAVFANYLQFNKRMDLLNSIIPRNSLSPSALAQVVKVA